MQRLNSVIFPFLPFQESNPSHCVGSFKRQQWKNKPSQDMYLRAGVGAVLAYSIDELEAWLHGKLGQLLNVLWECG